MQDTFVNYRGYRWLWANLVLLIVIIVAYLSYVPVGGHNGGTLIGYILGGIATAGIAYLMWFGVRKRAYRTSSNTLQGCLAAHIWLGLALTFIVPLHAGFQFGCNVHTVAYLLMVVVIGSGVWGAINYSTLAREIESHRGGGSVRTLIAQLEVLSRDLDGLCKGKSDAFLKLAQATDVPFNPSYWGLLRSPAPESVERETAAKLIAATPEGERDDGLKVLSLANKKRDLIRRISHEVKMFFKMRLWLLLHLPVSLALVVAVVIHIFSVFFNW